MTTKNKTRKHRQSRRAPLIIKKTTNKNTFRIKVKVIKELNRIKSTAPKYAEELNQWIKRIKARGCWPDESFVNASAGYYCPTHPSCISGKPGDCRICGMSFVKRDPADIARLYAKGAYEEIQKRIAKQENYAAYGITKKITVGEVIKIWCSNQKLRDECRYDWQWFINDIFEVLPQCIENPSETPLFDYGHKEYLINFPEDTLKEKIKYYEQTQQKKYSAPLSIPQWADVFDKSESLIRKWIQTPEPKTYHFERMKESPELYRLPLEEVPPEYHMDKFKKMIEEQVQIQLKNITQKP